MIADPERGSNRDSPKRARRFPVEGVVQYKARGASTWRRGAIVDVSQSGVLFTAAEPPKPGEQLELILGLASPLHASATVVRAAPSETAWHIGARFHELWFTGAAPPSP